ncbi:ABC transporter substrate-binding protein [Agromyces badenianii]|uniref:ABC transporter substrate-binding protein n=1 Tax=Agromyces badenianii TaxID=2080742 RepID=UPI000D591801|nr:ABC transporter substrate-binding protein [Agromyces badenianii]PWC03540.1 ABC transporter substrate-binding protein [Agromyces badenianii]
MNRSPLLAVAAAALLLGASACSSPAPSAPVASEPVTITFSSYNYGTQGAAGTGTQALLDRFAELHPEITVVPQGVPTAEVLTKAKADVAAGNAPDVVQIGYSKLAEAFETLPVQSLEHIAGDAWDAHVEGINKALVETGRNDGEIAALPYTISIPTVFYNADLFEAAGLDAEDPPTTIDEVRESAEAITAAGHHGVYFGIVDAGKSDYLTQSVIDSVGGSTVDDDGNVAVDSDEAIAGIEAIQSLTTDGLQPAVGLQDALASFSSGGLGMLVVSTAVSGTLQQAAEGNFELRTSRFPSIGKGEAKPTFSGAGLMVLSDDAAKQRAAWELISFLTSAEGYTMITEGIGYLPLREDIVEDPAYLRDYFEENTLLVPPMEQLASVSPYRSFTGPNANQAVVVLQDEAIEPIVLRGADASTTLSAAAARIRELTAE